jgi:hypothetical protein
MKFNLKNFYFRNKQVLLFLGAVFLSVMIFISFYKIKEGFDNSSIGEYAYLAPVPANNTWSQATQDTFIPIYTKNYKANVTGDTSGYVVPIAGIMKDALEEEGKYYISNNKWPYGSYMTNTVINLIKENLKNSGKPPDDAVIQRDLIQTQSIYNTREFYQLLFKDKESKETPTPLSYQIYMGTAQPPADASSASSVYSMTGLSSADYQSLTSICKNVLGQR